MPPDRSRRLKHPRRGHAIDEEGLLIQAATKFAKVDGGMMLGRLYCAIDCGLRLMEMLSLTEDDIVRNYEGTGRTMLHVRWTSAKSKKERFVPVVTTRLLGFLKTRRGKAFPFGHADGSRRNNFDPDWNELLRASKISEGKWVAKTYRDRYYKSGFKRVDRWASTNDNGNLHWHDLRHECGSRLAERGVPLVEIMILLGHSSLAMTQRYLNPELHSLATNMQKALVGSAAPTAGEAATAFLQSLKAALGDQAASALVTALREGAE